MAKYSWNNYAGTREPYTLPISKPKRGENHVIAYGMNTGLVHQITRDAAPIEVFEFGRSNGFFLVCEAHSGDQAGFLLRKFLKDAVLAFISRESGSEDAEAMLELDLGVK
jgi:hypothetical protein